MLIKIDNLGEYLKNARLEKGLSIKDTAAKIRVSLGYIGKIEKGAFSPSLEVIIKLCSCYDIPVGDIIGESNQIENKAIDLAKVLEGTNILFDGKKDEC